MEKHDMWSERLLTVKEAVEAFPTKVSLSALNGFIYKGVRGVKLETCILGDRRLTSEEAIFRFLRAQSVNADSKTGGREGGHGGGRPRRMTKTELLQTALAPNNMGNNE